MTDSFEAKIDKLREEFKLFSFSPILEGMIEEVAEALNHSVCYCSCGNGDISIDLNEERANYLFDSFDETIYYLTYFTRKYLNMDLSFPRYFEDTKSLVFWFEDGLLDDEEVDISLEQNE